MKCIRQETRNHVVLLLIALFILKSVESQPDIATSVIDGFGGASIVDLLPLPTNDSLVVFTHSGQSPFGASAGARGKLGVLRFTAGSVDSAISKLPSTLDVNCAGGSGNITITKATQDSTNSSRFWIGGFCQPGTGTSSFIIGTNSYASPIGTMAYGFIFMIDAPALNVVRAPVFYTNATIDNIIAGTGTFSNSVFLTGRILSNVTIGGWALTKLGTGSADAFVAKANTSLIVSSVTNIYCTTNIAAKIEAPTALWGPQSTAKPVGRLFVSVHQGNCSSMTVTSYTSPSVVSYTDVYPCTFQQCPYGAEFFADTGKWNADATGRFFRHFDPDPAQFGVLNSISAAGDDWVTMAASEYNAPFLNHTRWRRINYDLKNGAYDYPTGWRNPYYVD
eukprot:TRINITY_DN15576_c0_g1_i1.p1 TRINITY_DN15576_c0_g1~~TRINITY_DN15576_c0_g1_i1.p1  ORF type:complete len:392 (-),score=40.96 TRINITY_DN15576_c0_g1_i1:985-2160(-)